MKKDIETKLYQERSNRLRPMPEFIIDFILLKQTKLGLNTQIAYLKDYTIFLEYLLTLKEFEHYTSIDMFTIEDMKTLEEKNIWQFLEYLDSYSKTFIRKDGKEFTQTFSNTEQGKSRKLASIHKLFAYMERKYKMLDPSKYVEIEVRKRKQIKGRLTKEEVDLFVETIIDDVNIESKRKYKFHQRTKYRDLAMLLILAFTGIRVSELVQIDIKDISLQDGAMVVIRKGGDQEKIYMPEEIVPFLSDYIEERKGVLDIDIKYKDALFISNQKRRIDPKTVRYMIDKYAKRAGITINVTPHTFRRTFATKLLDLYDNIELVAKQLGHASIETSRRFYAELTEEKEKNSIQKFKY